MAINTKVERVKLFQANESVHSQNVQTDYHSNDLFFVMVQTKSEFNGLVGQFQHISTKKSHLFSPFFELESHLWIPVEIFPYKPTVLTNPLRIRFKTSVSNRRFLGHLLGTVPQGRSVGAPVP